MWLSVRIEDFAVTHQGLKSRPSGAARMYFSPGLNIEKIEDLRHVEYGQAIHVDVVSRTIKFGRDYLGQYPLLYALTDDYLYISDHVGEIRRALKQAGERVSISEEAVALYLIMGYVPQGMTLYQQIVACENATIYTLRKGRVSAQRIFEPVEIRHGVTDAELHQAIRGSVAGFIGDGEVDVWCSGGIDSSSMAWETCRATSHAELLTLSYGSSIERLYGNGEVPYARLMANTCGAKLREARLNDSAFQRVYADFLSDHIGPVIDTCAIAKYALAETSRSFALTGEGGDPLFGGVKNDFIMFAMAKNPGADIGLVYAQSHRRFLGNLNQLMHRGDELKDFAAGYLRRLVDRYPGDLLRKLFYLNTFEKQGGMIFPESYYPGAKYGVNIRHPLTSMGVYETAFAMPDSLRYVYPSGKLALMRLYQGHLPEEVLSRKKSGTLMPLRHYLTNFPEEYYDLSSLYGLEMFQQKSIQALFSFDVIVKDPLLLHTLITLNAYIHKGELNDELLSTESRRDDESRACIAV